MRRRGQSLQRPEMITKVNVTPIIDVALVLVIILLVTAPIITATDMRITLPEAHTRAAEDQRNISVTLGAEGEITVDKDRVARRDLARALRARLTEPGRDKDLVVVCADQGVAYAQVEGILEDARRAGAQRIAIATRQKQGRVK
jgi:biopolymer transport protein ExbD